MFGFGVEVVRLGQAGTVISGPQFGQSKIMPVRSPVIVD